MPTELGELAAISWLPARLPVPEPLVARATPDVMSVLPVR